MNAFVDLNWIGHTLCPLCFFYTLSLSIDQWSAAIKPAQKVTLELFPSHNSIQLKVACSKKFFLSMEMHSSVFSHPRIFNVKSCFFCYMTLSLSSQRLTVGEKVVISSNLFPLEEAKERKRQNSVVMSRLIFRNFNENQREFKCQCRWHVIMSCFMEKHCTSA